MECVNILILLAQLIFQYCYCDILHNSYGTLKCLEMSWLLKKM